VALSRALPDPPARRPQTATDTALAPDALAGARRDKLVSGEDAVNQENTVNHGTDWRERHTIVTHTVELIDHGPEPDWHRDRTPFRAVGALRAPRPQPRRR